MKELILKRLRVNKKLILVYIIVYFSWGMTMDAFGAAVGIAKFTYWWQVITCYILYMIPISLILRPHKWYEQYAYGLFFMGILEFGGYTLGTSIAFENNLLDQFFTERNFSLGMTLFFASYFPLGNWAVGRIYSAIFKK